MQSCAIFFLYKRPVRCFSPKSPIFSSRACPQPPPPHPRTASPPGLSAIAVTRCSAPLRVVIYAARYLLQSPSTRLPTERFMRPVRIMGRYRFALPITAPGQKAPVRICPPRCSHRWTAWHAATNPASTGFVTEFGVFVTFIYIVLHLSSQYTLTML